MPHELDAVVDTADWTLKALPVCGCRWVCECKLTACPHRPITRQPSAPKSSIIPWWRDE